MACGSWKYGRTFASGWSWRPARNKLRSAERTFKQVLEARVAEMGIGELKHGNIKDQIEQGMMKNTREDKVQFVVCAGDGAGKLHVRKNHIDMLVWTSMDSSGGRVPGNRQVQEMSQVVGCELVER